ncbi:MAG: 50S ribosomal protein L18 [Chloroflexota bacterium]|nr:50S ribosomal protein L18 [Chloroflexota bacterium]
MSRGSKKVKRQRRHRRLRKRLFGTGERPRLSVFRSLKHIYAQIIDDERGRTLVASATVEPALRDQINGMDKTAQAELVGRVLAQRALNAGIDKVIFDRGGYKYHGRVKALAEAAREEGLVF